MFTNAIVRRPGPEFGQGITTAELGVPDYDLALEQHARYCEALERCGLDLVVLESDPAYPDCPFVEDTAVVTEHVAVIARPGAGRRRGEELAVAGILSAYRPIEHIESPGTLDGGDVLQMGKRFFVGLSARTNFEGARQIGSILTRHRYSVMVIPVGDMLHLKSGVNHAGGDALAVSGDLAELDVFSGFDLVSVPEEESYAANCLFVNGRLLVAKGFPRALAAFERLGREIIELDVSEFRKMDGGLTCLSIRF
jgi:dimethylargininase